MKNYQTNQTRNTEKAIPRMNTRARNLCLGIILLFATIDVMSDTLHTKLWGSWGYSSHSGNYSLGGNEGTLEVTSTPLAVGIFIGQAGGVVFEATMGDSPTVKEEGNERTLDNSVNSSSVDILLGIAYAFPLAQKAQLMTTVGLLWRSDFLYVPRTPTPLDPSDYDSLYTARPAFGYFVSGKVPLFVVKSFYLFPELRMGHLISGTTELEGQEYTGGFWWDIRVGAGIRLF